MKKGTKGGSPSVRKRLHRPAESSSSSSEGSDLDDGDFEEADREKVPVRQTTRPKSSSKPMMSPPSPQKGKRRQQKSSSSSSTSSSSKKEGKRGKDTGPMVPPSPQAAGRHHRVRRQRGDSSSEEEEELILHDDDDDDDGGGGGGGGESSSKGAARKSAGEGGKSAAGKEEKKEKAGGSRLKRVKRDRSGDDVDEDDDGKGGGRAAAGGKEGEGGGLSSEGEEEEEWVGLASTGASQATIIRGGVDDDEEEEHGGMLRSSQATTVVSAQGRASGQGGGRAAGRRRETAEAEETLREVFGSGGGGGRRKRTRRGGSDRREADIMEEVKRLARGTTAAAERAWKGGGRRGDDDDDDDDGDGDGDEEGLDDFIVEDEDDDLEGGEKDFPVRCVCGATTPGDDPDEELWIECTNEECSYWVHGRCFNLTRQEDVPKKFRCHMCGGGMHQAQAQAEKLIKKYPPLELYSLLEDEGKGEEGKGKKGSSSSRRQGGGGRRSSRFEEALHRLGGKSVLQRLHGPYRKSGVTLLMRAAELGRVDEVKVLLSLGAKVMERDSLGGRTAAMYALAGAMTTTTTSHDDDACIAVLSELHKAEPMVALMDRDGHSRNVLHYAASRGGSSSKAVLGWLIQRLGEEAASRMARHRDDEGKTPLLTACDEGLEASVLTLLRYGADGAKAVTSGGGGGGRGVNGVMLCISRGMSTAAQALARAAEGGALLAQRDEEGATCLHYAAGKGDAASAAAILAVMPGLADLGDDAQVTALHYAAADGHTDVVTTLLANGARPDVRDERGWTPLLYADFKAREDCILSLLAVDPHSQLVLLGELLRGQRGGAGSDERIARVLKGLTVVPSYLRLINDIVARSPELLDTSLSFLLDTPDLLDLRNKTAYLESQLQHLRLSVTPLDPYGMGIVLPLRRQGAWTDMCRKLLGKDASLVSPESALRGRVMFQLTDGEGVGPGVEREVLELISRGLVEGGESAAFCLAPDQSSYIPMDHHHLSPICRGEAMRVLYAVGLLLGHVLLWRKNLIVNFNPCFLKLVLRRPLRIDDLADLDESVTRSLRYILDNEGAADLDLNFTWSGGEGGQEDVELCAGGKSKGVTDDNKEEYVSLVVKHLTEGRMGKQAARVRDGINAVFQDPRGRLLGLYTAQEFGTLVGGVGDIDPSAWEQTATYAGYRTNAPQIEWLWRFVRSLSTTERALLLKFSTGQSCLPVGGFQNLHPPFQVVWVPFETSVPLPKAATCFHQLKLPCYPSYEDLERYVLLAIRFGSEGFAFT